MAVHVIEDDAAVRDAIEELARSDGHDVVGYMAAEAFLAGPSPPPTDVVVLDAGLPGMSGAATAEALRARGPAPPILMVSGLRGAAYDRAKRKMDPNADMRKPLDASAFLDLLGRLAGRR
ncbi:MAG: response regulator [Pseudomonadota bacterium]